MMQNGYIFQRTDFTQKVECASSAMPKIFPASSETKRPIFVKSTVKHKHSQQTRNDVATIFETKTIFIGFCRRTYFCWVKKQESEDKNGCSSSVALLRGPQRKSKMAEMAFPVAPQYHHVVRGTKYTGGPKILFENVFGNDRSNAR
jgi:hypothetical protein